MVVGPDTPAGATELDPAALADRSGLSAALTVLRDRRGLSVRDVARLSSLPLATVAGYLAGRHLPQPSTLDQFRRVLAALGVPPAEQGPWTELVGRLGDAFLVRVVVDDLEAGGARGRSVVPAWTETTGSSRRSSRSSACRPGSSSPSVSSAGPSSGCRSAPDVTQIGDHRMTRIVPALVGVAVVVGVAACGASTGVAAYVRGTWTCTTDRGVYEVSVTADRWTLTAKDLPGLGRVPGPRLRHGSLERRERPARPQDEQRPGGGAVDGGGE